MRVRRRRGRRRDFAQQGHHEGGDGKAHGHGQEGVGKGLHPRLTIGQRPEMS
jgi:hypothetical protein